MTLLAELARLSRDGNELTVTMRVDAAKTPQIVAHVFYEDPDGPERQVGTLSVRPERDETILASVVEETPQGLVVLLTKPGKGGK